MDASPIATPSKIPTVRDVVESFYSVGHSCLTNHRELEAADFFRAMVSMAPQDERGWIGIALCHEKLGQLEIAREIYGTGAALAQSVRCRLGQYAILKRLGDMDRADAVFDSALTIAEQADQDTQVLVQQFRAAK